MLAVESKQLLIGESADPDMVDGLKALVASEGGVVGVGDVLTIHSSPDQITVLMSVDFEDSLTAGEVERMVERIEDESQARWPQVHRMFIRPNSGAARLVLPPVRRPRR